MEKIIETEDTRFRFILPDNINERVCIVNLYPHLYHPSKWNKHEDCILWCDFMDEVYVVDKEMRLSIFIRTRRELYELYTYLSNLGHKVFIYDNFDDIDLRMMGREKHTFKVSDILEQKRIHITREYGDDNVFPYYSAKLIVHVPFKYVLDFLWDLSGINKLGYLCSWLDAENPVPNKQNILIS